MRRPRASPRVALLGLAVAAGVLLGLTFAARGYEPYPTLRELLATELVGRDAPGRLPAPREAAGGLAVEEARKTAADRRALALRRRPSSAPRSALADVPGALALRAGLRRTLRAAGGRPHPPARLTTGVRTAMSRPLAGTARVDRLVIAQPHGIDSIVEVHTPAAPTSSLVVVHGGHGGVEGLLRSTMEALLADGHVVAAMNMPLHDWNPAPAVRLPRVGTLVLNDHDLLALLPGPRDRLLGLFVNPVLQVVREARRRGLRRLGMVGLSGGGWTTILAAALEPRIRVSASVAGNLPLHLASERQNQGDLEQMGLPLLRRTSYADLYVLGALEPGRHQLHELNDADPCCFAVDRPPPVFADVRERVRRLGGGRLDVAVSPHDEHSVAPPALRRIVRAMRQLR